ncbi:MAG: HlyD family efflux transporter periplasmic adaptor subunit [Mesorhizobium sp.]|nr:MAG: HlyD family efflux transporter periplasmic adaptor subunit [Mesorhizobium sp.]RWM53976.1 MAG: HlyD family efflux transporter periplasmic adaptor subunit [Mesorhizobium sp.]RWM60904.1 MAG: HlyD family efflux transporter periplasmic adaptor subunit [Mesorhizobium sp.]RWM62556.1 MAG: HlyD family efflux transporter periplasmic adaptor subunit [Mesorhizobium sp.]RWN03838.1 MAG: HlyD family efflux transporter periplasmic adaptor subunit [Mesorhizobium sp.]
MLVPSPAKPSLPEFVLPAARPRTRLWLGLTLVVVAGAAAAGGYWLQHAEPGLPAGIAFGNGRVEADEIDIAAKFSGRIAALLVDEGDTVRAGQVVARMDTQDLEMSLGKAEAQVIGANRMLDEARASVEQQKAQAKLAEQQLTRTIVLVDKGYATAEVLDQRHQQMDAASAALAAANARVGQAAQTLAAANHDADLYRINIADNSLVAPRDGRVQYRLANIGEVVGAGGKVLTVLDTGYVYMDIFLPTSEAGRTTVGSDARIVLDAAPNAPIPAKVVFVSAEAQFTPKAVETKAERDKLMFRVRVRVDPNYLRTHAAEMSSGLPGLAYVRLNGGVEWPASLALGRTDEPSS